MNIYETFIFPKEIMNHGKFSVDERKCPNEKLLESYSKNQIIIQYETNIFHRLSIKRINK